MAGIKAPSNPSERRGNQTWKTNGILIRMSTSSAPIDIIHGRENTMTTIFSKIIKKEIPSDMVYQDEYITAFRDIEPQAPVHILIVPNKEIPTVNDIQEEDEQLIGKMFTAARKIAAEEGIAADGYRLLINCNKHGGQEVFHVHMHLFGGRPLGPMLLRR
jgi:histidine triad (HIT) family protein